MDSSNDDFIGGLRRGEMASDHFTIVSNALARDRAISYRAKGVFLNMISHRQGFRITESFLMRMGTEGEKAIRAALVELRNAGYIYRGAMLRFPSGTTNGKGKDISGSRAGYEYFITDKPEEVAIILERYAKEQRAANLAGLPADDDTEPAGEDNRPKRQLVPTSENAPDADPETQPAETAVSPDQAKQGVPAGHHNLPVPPGGFGSTKEDQPKKNNKKNNGGTLPPDPLRTQPPSGPVTVEPEAPSAATSNGGRQQGDHKRADVRVHVDPHMDNGSRNVNQLAKVLSMANRRLTHQATLVRAYRLLMDATSRATLEALAGDLVASGTSPQEAPGAAFRQQIETVFTAAGEEGRLGKIVFEWPPARTEVEPVNQLDQQRADHIAKIRQQAGVPRGSRYAQLTGNAGQPRMA